MAEFFIGKAEEHSPELRQRWCLIAAANALWSAVEIFNNHVAGDDHERLTSKRGKPTNTTNWFKQHEPLVERIRGGAVHSGQPQGIGESVDMTGPVAKEASFVWVGLGGEEIPVDDALLRFARVTETIKQHAQKITRTFYIRFG